MSPVLLSLMYAALWYSPLLDDSEAEIARGDYILSKHVGVGWINLRHARKEGSTRMLENLNHAWKRADRGRACFDFTYAQGMHGPLLGWTISSRYEASYSIPTNTPEEQLTLVAWHIFKDVSVNFEKMQGEFPSGIDPRSWHSSFRQGDLLGNALSFYAAVRNLSADHISGLVAGAEAVAALDKWQQNKPKKVKGWQAVLETHALNLPSVAEALHQWDKAAAEAGISNKVLKISGRQRIWELD